MRSSRSPKNPERAKTTASRSPRDVVEVWPLAGTASVFAVKALQTPCISTRERQLERFRSGRLADFRCQKYECTGTIAHYKRAHLLWIRNSKNLTGGISEQCWSPFDLSCFAQAVQHAEAYSHQSSIAMRRRSILSVVNATNTSRIHNWCHACSSSFAEVTTVAVMYSWLDTIIQNYSAVIENTHSEYARLCVHMSTHRLTTDQAFSRQRRLHLLHPPVIHSSLSRALLLLLQSF